MSSNFIKICTVFCALLAPGLAATGWASAYVTGAAELGYVKYDAEVDGKEVFSGHTFAQKYSLAYKATNLRHRSQPRYYNLMLGYDWMSFDTTASDQNQELDLKQSFGKIKYSGDVGYAGSELPFKVRAYINDEQMPIFKYGINSTGLIDDGLIYTMQGRGTYVASGVSFLFDPRAATSSAAQGLPRMILDYRDTTNKSSEGFIRVDNRTRELAVAGLNMENNWVNYRKLTYDNYLDANDKYTRQQIQIGLVDHRGRRQWSALTNWIELSVDGQLTDIKSPSRDMALEEYDVNFMAIATRKLWNARSFMNYNRQLDSDSLTEITRVPVYVKGIYGTETDWYASLSAIRDRQKIFPQNGFNTAATNTISVGGTTFNRSRFTLSPSLRLQTTKSYDGVDSYSFDTSLETNSTRRFSDQLGLAGKLTFRATDNGYDTAQSKTWSTLMDLTATYAPHSRVSYKLQDTLESGSGSGYLEANRLLYGTSASSKVGTYVRNYLFGSVKWVPNSVFSTSLDASYDIIKATDLRPSDMTIIIYQAGYNNEAVSARFDSKYLLSSNGYDSSRSRWINNAEIQYRPDRYNDGLFRLNHEKEEDVNLDRSRLGILQRYSFNLFTRVGLLRNLATFTEEYSYTSDENFGSKSSAQYLMFSGRYNPTERLSLYGSVKYETASPGSVTMYYSGGMSADFKLLTTTLDYTYARRDSDNRQEKRLSAYVRRDF